MNTAFRRALFNFKCDRGLGRRCWESVGESGQTLRVVSEWSVGCGPDGPPHHTCPPLYTPVIRHT